MPSMEGLRGTGPSPRAGSIPASRVPSYQLLAHSTQDGLARRLVKMAQDGRIAMRFVYHETQWGKFADGTDNIKVGGFVDAEGRSRNQLRGQHVVFLASFHSNDVSMSQFHVFIMLLQSFIESLTIVLPFYPCATMERVTVEGQVATANTMAQMFSHLPSCGRPTRVMVYDLHTLQNRFYLSNHAVANLQSAVPLMLDYLLPGRSAAVIDGTRASASDCNGARGIVDESPPSAPAPAPAFSDSASASMLSFAPEMPIDGIAFPDDGAAKRFKSMFEFDGRRDAWARAANANGIKFEIIVCGKHRMGEERRVTVLDGDPRGKHLLIVDDLVQTGGTLFECGKALRDRGAASVSAFVVHSVFPNESWRRFAHGGDRSVFRHFFTTNTVPTVANALPKDDVFVVFDVAERLVEDLQWG